MTSKAPTPKLLVLPLTQLCEQLALRPAELALKADMLLDSLDVQAGAIVLRSKEKRPASKALKHRMTKAMNTGLNYDVSFYDVLVDDTRLICIEATSSGLSPMQLKPLTLTHEEVSETLEVDRGDVLSHLAELAELLIVEDAVELQLARLKPQGGEDMPMITISMTGAENVLEPVPTVSARLEDSPVKFKLVKGLSPAEAAVLIQRHFKAKLIREQVELLRRRAAREEHMKLTYRTIIKDEKGSAYVLSVFAGKTAYEVKAQRDTLALTCSIDKAQIVNAKVKSVSSIVAMLKITGNQLVFEASTASSAVKLAMEAAFSIEARAKIRKLLSLRKKELDGNSCMLTLFQVDTGLLIECLSLNPEIDSTKITMSVPTHALVEMFGSELPIEEVFDSISLANGQLILQPTGRLLLRRASKPDLNKDYETAYRRRIVTQRTKLIRNKLYVIIMSLQKSDVDSVYNDSDILIFEVQPNSSSEAKREVGIDLKTASQITGLQQDMLMPIGHVIITRMLDIRAGEVILDASAGPVNVDRSASLITAHLRGFIIRKNLLTTIDKLKRQTVGRLVLLKVVEMAGKIYGVSVRLDHEEMKIEAANLEEGLAVSVNTGMFAGFRRISPERVALKYILPSLGIEEMHDTRKLVFDLDVGRRIKADTAHEASRDRICQRAHADTKEVVSAKPINGEPTHPSRGQDGRLGSHGKTGYLSGLQGEKANLEARLADDRPAQSSDVAPLDSQAVVFDEFEPVKAAVHPQAIVPHLIQVISSSQEKSDLNKPPLRQTKGPQRRTTHHVSSSSDSSSHDAASEESSESGSSYYKSPPHQAHLRASKPSRGIFKPPIRTSTDSFMTDPLSPTMQSSLDRPFELITSSSAYIPNAPLNRRPSSGKSSNSNYSEHIAASSEGSSLNLQPALSSKAFFSSLSSSSTDLLLRTGHKIDRVSFVVSLFRQEDYIQVEAVSQRQGLHLFLQVEGSFSPRLTPHELDSICSNILSRLTLIRSRQGNISLDLSPDEAEEQGSILYKKLHLISHRHFVVSVKETAKGVVISAYDPEANKTLECSLGRRNVDDQEVQEELAELMPRLKIRRVLGDYVLVITP
jgi:hypothetical protein